MLGFEIRFRTTNRHKKTMKMLCLFYAKKKQQNQTRRSFGMNNQLKVI